MKKNLCLIYLSHFLPTLSIILQRDQWYASKCSSFGWAFESEGGLHIQSGVLHRCGTTQILKQNCSQITERTKVDPIWKLTIINSQKLKRIWAIKPWKRILEMSHERGNHPENYGAIFRVGKSREWEDWQEQCEIKSMEREERNQIARSSQSGSKQASPGWHQLQYSANPP